MQQPTQTPPPPPPPPPPRPSSPSPPPMDESPLSPLRSASSLSSTSAPPPPKTTTIVSVEKYYSPLTSPLPLSPPKSTINFNRVAEVGGHGVGTVEKGVRFGAVEEIVERRGTTTTTMTRRWWEGSVGVVAGLGVRVCEVVLCLISFSVLASDRTPGWSGDSFDRYKEYRYCLSVNIIAFVYSGFQAFDQTYHLVTGKHVITHHLRHQFDFVMDQVLAYLLISASSSAATRILDWQLNWGKDEFTEKASASVSMSFLAFIAFAISSLISGYNICNHEFA